MPTVPLYNTPQASPTNLPDARQQAPFHLLQMATIGPDQQQRLGVGIEQAGNEANRIFQQQQYQQDLATARDSSNAATNIMHNMMLDPDTGFLTRNGKDAIPGGTNYNNIMDSLDKLPQQIGDGIESDQARAIFQTNIQNQINAAKEQVRTHAAREFQKYDQETIAGTAQSASQMAIGLGAVDPTANNRALVDSFQRQHDALDALAKSRGLEKGTDAYDQFMQVGPDGKSGMASTHAGIVSNLLAPDPRTGRQADPKMAQAYLNSVDDKEMPPLMRNKLNDAIASSIQEADSVKVFQKVRADNPDDLSAQLAAVDKMNLPDQQYKQVTQLIHSRYSMEKEAEQQRAADTIQKVWDFKNQNPNAAYTDLPDDIRAAVTAQKIGEHVGRIMKVDNSRDSNPDVVADVVNQFNRGGSSDITKMSDQAFFGLRDKLSESDFNRFNTERNHFLQGKTSKDPGGVSMSDFRDSFKERQDGLELGFDPKTPEGKANIGASQKFAIDYLIRQQQQAGHKFDRDEIDKAMDSLFSKSEDFKTTLFGHTLSTTTKPLMSVEYGDIDKNEVAGITKALKDRGNGAPTQMDILNEYRRHHAGLN